MSTTQKASLFKHGIPGCNKVMMRLPTRFHHQPLMHISYALEKAERIAANKNDEEDVPVLKNKEIRPDVLAQTTISSMAPPCPTKHPGTCLLRTCLHQCACLTTSSSMAPPCPAKAAPSDSVLSCPKPRTRAPSSHKATCRCL